MAINSISTYSLNQAIRQSIQRAQSDLADAQVEVSTGRAADVGLSLGTAVGTTLSARTQVEELKNRDTANSLVAGRLEASQSALSQLVTNANSMMSNLVAAQSSTAGQQTAASESSGFLDSFRDTANTSQNGAYVFGGINASQAPISDYNSTSTSSAKAAVQAAFSSYFGFDSTDQTNVAKITPSQMTAFLNGPFANIFSGSGWSNFSQASSTNMKDQISSSQTVETSTNTNDQSFRDLASAYVMVADLGTASLSQDTFKAVAQAATSKLSTAISGLGVVQSKLGFVQEQVTSAQKVSSTAQTLLNKQIGSLEDVDSYDASTQLTALSTQLETSYAITAKIQKLSILNYL